MSRFSKKNYVKFEMLFVRNFFRNENLCFFSVVSNFFDCFMNYFVRDFFV